MPNNPLIKGDQTVLFGSGGYLDAGSSFSGIIVSGNKKLAGDKLEVRDENGFVIASIYFNDMQQFSFEMIIKTAAPDLKRGDALKLAAVVNALVDDVEEVWAQADNRKLRVNATRYLGMTL